MKSYDSKFKYIQITGVYNFKTRFKEIKPLFILNKHLILK